MKTNFSKIKDSVLRKNLDIVFNYVLILFTLSEAKKYDAIIKSSFRKSVVIYTSSIIEAMILYLLKQKIKSEKIILSNEWKYFNIVPIHKISNNPTEEVISGFRKNEIKNIESIDFYRMNDLCLKHKSIDEELFNEVNEARKLRNRLHIGGLKEVERNFNSSDLKFIFMVAEKVKNLL